MDRRARIAGDIQRLESEEEKRSAAAEERIYSLRKEMRKVTQDHRLDRAIHERTKQSLQLDLSALDLVIGQHEIHIDVKLIQPIQSHLTKRLTHWGDMSRAICECLRHANGKSCTPTFAAAYVMSRLNVQVPSAQLNDFRHAVRQRMNALGRKGLLIRIPTPGSNTEARWILNTDYSEDLSLD